MSIIIDGTNGITFPDTSNQTAAVVIGTSNIVPSGVVLPFAGSAAPTGWLLAYGQPVSRTTYSSLFTAISTTYGTGDGSTTFNLPDLRGRAVAGVDNMGGSAANRLTSGGSGITGTTLGASGGAETFTITTTQMPSHSHNLGVGGSVGGTANGYYPQSVTGSLTTQSAGSGGASNVTQPTIVINYIIKT